MTDIDRRGFLRTGLTAATLGVVAGGPLAALSARTADASTMVKRAFSPDYGPLYPVKDHTTGLELLKLPRGFEYVTHGWTGDRMTDGRPTPGAHDGMAAFTPSDALKDRTPAGGAGGAGKGHWTVLVRNHEVGSYRGAFVEPAYNPAAGGGTTSLIFDTRKGEFLESWASLGGTIRNCAGGPTPWGSWLSCEETTEINGSYRHGYVFEVPHDGIGDAKPYKEMGRFSHEAVAVDPETGWVYETEDATPSGFYRFRPKAKGDLAQGGVLEMMTIGASAYTTYKDGTGVAYPEIGWVVIDSPDPGANETSVVRQGIAKGGASFARLEGAWYHDGKIYIVSTSGGPAGQGQVFEYEIAANTMRVLFASPDATVLNNPDNICVSPRGGIVLCEDGSGVEYLHGLTTDGEIFPFAENAVVIPAGGVPGKSVAPGTYTGSEWCGSVFDSRDGGWLFANIQSPGITFAITGPWENGSL